MLPKSLIKLQSGDISLNLVTLVGIKVETDVGTGGRIRLQ